MIDRTSLSWIFWLVVILVLILASGCSVAPRYFTDDRGNCHAISEGKLIFDVDCSTLRGRR